LTSLLGAPSGDLRKTLVSCMVFYTHVVALGQLSATNVKGKYKVLRHGIITGKPTNSYYESSLRKQYS